MSSESMALTQENVETVLDELQNLSDSSNNEKRAKGRRGLK